MPIHVSVLGLVNTLEAQTHAPLVCVYADNAQRNDLLFFDHFFGVCNMPVRQFRDMNQPFNLFVTHDVSKGAKLGQLGDNSFHQLVNHVPVLHQFPGVGLESLQAEANAAALPVNVEHIDLHLVTYTQDLARMIDSFPGKL